MSEERRSPQNTENNESGLLLSVDPTSDRSRDSGLGDDTDATDATDADAEDTVGDTDDTDDTDATDITADDADGTD